tara:strand:- start:107 stop:508 length:402 start_codon:yes stop_codon:yes gene_type:complete
MPFIGTSFVIASMRPKALAGFYGSINEVKVLEGYAPNYFVVPLQNGLRIQIYRPSLDQYDSSGGKTTAICFQKNPSSNPSVILKECSSDLIKLGATSTSNPRIESFGVEQWFSDPDGNEFLIFVPLSSYINNH